MADPTIANLVVGLDAADLVEACRIYLTWACDQGRWAWPQGRLPHDVKFVHAEKLSYKKDADCRRTGPSRRRRRQAQWIKYRDRIDPARPMFIDETWTKTNMAPLRGWSPRGQRIKAKGAAWPIADHDLHGRLAPRSHHAPRLIEGPINGEAFLLYIEKVLVPTLRYGDIVIMDICGRLRGSELNLWTKWLAYRVLTPVRPSLRP
ncbi:hypothetical protein [Bradyrhizobium sp. BR 1433]|uniref:hypothetical protein n=1 Tax=Bradyrhizobium sp. BR 1433 TaxID=3447967 RepID=UPI003EE747B1